MFIKKFENFFALSNFWFDRNFENFLYLHSL